MGKAFSRDGNRLPAGQCRIPPAAPLWALAQCLQTLAFVHFGRVSAMPKMSPARLAHKLLYR